MTARLRASVLMAAAVCAGLSLAGCSSTNGEFDLDPSTWFPDGKKKLAGERRELFPGGVPGVTQGVPPELIKGSPQQQAVQNAEAAPPPEQPKPEAKSQPKARPKKVARPAPPPADPDEQPAPRQVQRQAQPAGAWPAPQGGQPQQQPAPANSAWPAPPGPGTFTR